MPRSGEWFSFVVYEAVDLGLMGGYTPEDGGAPIMFGAYDSLTRGQLALVLYRMVNGEEPDGETARVEAAKVLVTTYKLLIDNKF